MNTTENSNVLYFAYGSNINKNQMNDRLKDFFVKSHGIYRVLDHEFLYNKKSSLDFSGKANLGEKQNAYVLGLLYELEKNGFEELKKHEVGYKVKTISTLKYSDENEKVDACAFLAIEPSEEEIPPTGKYINTIIEGMEKEGFPLEYVNAIKRETF